jgi:hypothetical protein
MKKRFLISLVLLFVLVVLTRTTVLAYGRNFSFPAARYSRIVPNGGYTGSHKAYDYRFPSHTKVVAAKGGTVTQSEWEYADGWPSDCTGGIRDRGNYIILDHGSGLTTEYFHLSNTDPSARPGVGRTFSRGSYMAPSDNNGCSTADHLHFATKLNGIPFDPYAGTTDWVSAQPIPMGYRDQNGTINGSYPLIDTKIEARWVAEEGKPGSPLGSKYSIICPQKAGMQVTGYRQDFERGYIEYCGTSSADYVGYAQTYLPDIRTIRDTDNGWNSTIVVRNDSPVPASVNITIYNSGGTVVDSRTNKILGTKAAWSLNVHDVVFDWLVDSYELFEGSAIVTADRDVSIVVIQHRPNPERWAAYSGISQVSAEVHTPLLYKNHYGINSSLFIENTGVVPTNVTIEFKASLGTDCNHTYNNIKANGMGKVNLSGISCLGTSFYGAARIINSAIQPLAVTSATYTGSSLSEVENAGSLVGAVYAPLIQNYNYNWVSGSSLQNASGSSAGLSATFYNSNGQQCTYSWYGSFAAYFARVNTTPPGNPPCTSVASAIFHGDYLIEAVVNQVLLGGVASTDYRAVTVPGYVVSIPLWRNQWNGWTTGMVIQNVNDQPVDVTITYYNADGSINGAPQPRVIQPRVIDIISNTPGVLDGSVTVVANLPIAIIVNHSVSGGGDGGMSYTPVHR